MPRRTGRSERMSGSASVLPIAPSGRLSGQQVHRDRRALAVGGVYTVLTHRAIPGMNAVGLEHADQLVLAQDVLRYQGAGGAGRGRPSGNRSPSGREDHRLLRLPDRLPTRPPHLIRDHRGFTRATTWSATPRLGMRPL
jgi:hypothetical protein